VLILDDVLTFPARSIFWIFRQVCRAAEQELADEAENATARLAELYMMLETGRISEAEFAAEEKTVLDRLEELRESDGGVEGRHRGKKKGDSLA